MKNINLKKKNSFAKIIKMKYNDNFFENTVIFSIILIGTVMFIPFVIPTIPNWIGSAIIGTLFLMFFAILFIIYLMKKIIAVFTSLSRIRYIPLNECEVYTIKLDTIEKYAEFINDLITCNGYRCKIPKQIANRVIGFSELYYPNTTVTVIEPHNFNNYEVHNKYLMYEPYMNDYDIACSNFDYVELKRQKNKNKFIICDKVEKYNTKEMRDYLKKHPLLAEEWDLKLDTGTKVKLLRRNNNV